MSLTRLALVASASLALAAVAPGVASADAVPSVRVCHATSSDENPYILNSPSTSGNLSGHLDHAGPVWGPTLKDSHTAWGDVIPPLTLLVNGVPVAYPGLNWGAVGEAFWKNGCAMPDVLPPDGPPVGDPPAKEDPVVEDPVVEDPVVEDPVVEDPVVEDPVVEDPVIEDPVIEDPVVEDPVVEDPVNEAPTDTFTGGSGTITVSRPAVVTLGSARLPLTGVPVDTWSVAGAGLLGAGLLLLLAGRRRTPKLS